MPRTARIARTAHDLDHVNHLRFPAFQLVSLFLKAGAKTSKSYTTAPQAGDGGGSDDFHFLPEMETIEIHYQIDDPFVIADHGKLELFTRFEDKPLWSLDLAALGDDWLTHGKHVVKWDGRIVNPSAKQEGTAEGEGISHDLNRFSPDKTVHPAFPDGYITLEHTPYELRITLTADSTPELAGRPAEAWTYFHLLIKGYEFVLGEELIIPGGADRDKAVRKQIETDGGVPAPNAVRKVVLTSNIFSVNDNERTNDTAFVEYQKAWQNGPKIPVIAKIRLASSDDTAVKLEEAGKGAVALGRAKFLWDWEDPDETFTHSEKPKAFISAAIDYYKATTGPKGDNCHKDHGGKRGAGADAIFPPQAGYDPADNLQPATFPFPVTASAGRNWAAFSQAWTRGKLKGCTGVVFEPSRIAGDDYKLSIYLAYDRTAKDKLTLDVDSQPLTAPDAIKATTGLFQLWRGVDIARYIRKTAAVPDLTAQWGQAADIYKQAYIDLRHTMPGDNKYLIAEHKNPVNATTPIDYNGVMDQALQNARTFIYSDRVVVDDLADHAAVPAAFSIRPYQDMVAMAHAMLHDWNTIPATLVGSSRGASDTTYEVDLAALGGVSDHLMPEMAVIMVQNSGGFDRAPTLVRSRTPSHVTVRGGKAPANSNGAGGDLTLFGASLDFPDLVTTAGPVADQLDNLATRVIPPPPTSQPVQIAPAPGVARAGGFTVVFTTQPHGFAKGDSVTVSGVADNSFNLAAKVTDVESTTSFSIPNPGPFGHSGGGFCSYLAMLRARISAAARASNVATFTTTAATGLQPGDSVKLLDQPFSGDFTVKTASATSFTIDSAGTDSLQTPYDGRIVKTFKIPIGPVVATPGIERTGNMVTVNTLAPHGLNDGDVFVFSGVADNYFNKLTRVIAAGVTSPTAFEYKEVLADMVSGGGTVTKEDDQVTPRLRATQNWLQKNNFQDAQKYSTDLAMKLPKILGQAGFMPIDGGKTAAAPEGMTVIHFDGIHDQEGTKREFLGASEHVPDANRYKCALILCGDPMVTFIHEAGHHLFLPHARYPTNSVPGGALPDRHDDDDDKCTMSYNDPTRSFCGLCQLRLRGWSSVNLKKDDAGNTKK